MLNPDVLATLIDERKALPGALLPILHAVQDRLGYIPDAAVPLIAKAVNQTRAEVHGVITYYKHFRRHPPGEHVLQVCRAEACQANGADGLVAHVRARLGCDFHQTSRDGKVTLEPVYCLGHCAVGPNIQLDDDLYARVGADELDELIRNLKPAT